MNVYSLIECGDQGEVVGVEPLDIIEINSPEQLAALLGLALADLETTIREADK